MRSILITALALLVSGCGYCGLSDSEKAYQEDKAILILSIELDKYRPIDYGVIDCTENNLIDYSIFSDTSASIFLDDFIEVEFSYSSYSIDSAVIHNDRGSWWHTDHCVLVEKRPYLARTTHDYGKGYEFIAAKDSNLFLVDCRVKVFVSLTNADTTINNSCSVFRSDLDSTVFEWMPTFVFDK